jgi:threonine synthase
MFGRFLQEDNRQVTILTATSGDTGAAVAHAFHNIPGVRVIVLFPMDEVSESQRKLMTTLKDNIRTVAIDGKFDDCQAMVKQAFADPALKNIPLSSANSINIGRLLPQSVYYFYAASRVAQAGEPVVFSIPSGNFGDMMGCVVAREMGLPLKKIICAVNDNDAFPKFLATGHYEKISPSRNSLSNAFGPAAAEGFDELHGWRSGAGR